VKVHELKTGRQWLIRLETDGELYGQILGAAKDLGVQAASLTVLGALQGVGLRIYNQTAKRYEDYRIDEEVELLGGVGNVSLREGEPFLHCHVTVGTRDGKAFGGHLHETDPSTVFVGEVWMQELLGEPPVRLMDERCGLMLW
jgi:predicted DNA-binding protein with PD1-like motif